MRLSTFCLCFLATLLLVSGPARAATLVIDAITDTSTGNLETLTIGSQTYFAGPSPTTVLNTEPASSDGDSNNSTDYVHVAPAPPSSLAAAIASKDLFSGTLNQNFDAQFGGALSDSSLIYILETEGDTDSEDTATVRALDAGGGVLGTASLDIDPLDLVSLDVQDHNRTTNGSSAADLDDRVLLGFAFTLEDLGLDGLGATGIGFETSGLDVHEIGIAQVVPEPSCIAMWSLIGMGLAGFGYRQLRRKA